MASSLSGFLKLTRRAKNMPSCRLSSQQHGPPGRASTVLCFVPAAFVLSFLARETSTAQTQHAGQPSSASRLTAMRAHKESSCTYRSNYWTSQRIPGGGRARSYPEPVQAFQHVAVFADVIPGGVSKFTYCSIGNVRSVRTVKIGSKVLRTREHFHQQCNSIAITSI